jgi:hypothetical protein
MADIPKIVRFEEGFVEIPISYEELFTVIRTLEYSRAAFEHLIKESETHGDVQLVDVFRARADLCKAFAEKFYAVAKVGQPSDDSKH